ncbi:dehydrogenase/reductase SDR family member 4-like isoform X2 [Tachyglossus aculeatus]|uniref:dehydrogenase/reductase SDR family member 4-like isoform X2 n=1 Tax=Tachyglossus aculeatus TaxID=9261 RepID=UPI0018F32F77|nr:dehydrogenase/reductase SDR family member 4-like isoform X2 [Tachyglossus aculeatus]
MQRALLRPSSALWRSVSMGSSSRAAPRDLLANKVALVTASTDGIGLAVARRLGQDGAHVVLSSRKQKNVDRAVTALQAEGLSVSGTVCHVGKAEDRERLVATALERYGGIDILVSNAAVNPFFGSLLDASEEVWDKILDINVKATALLVKAVVPEMEKRGGGSVVIVSSIAAFAPFPFWKDQAAKASILEAMKISRLGEPEDCAGIVSFLCSPDANYITGETVVVGGGTPSRL